MGLVAINPRYQEMLEKEGLKSVEDFLEMPAVIISGHPDRNVSQVTLGSGPTKVRGYLKREHRIPLRDRIANGFAGFGFVSKSLREAAVLRHLEAERLGGPEVLAAGEDRQGRAFLFVRELVDAVELRKFLRDKTGTAQARRAFARQLGTELARLHKAGLDHPDLYSKHVLIQPENRAISFLDWQRSNRISNAAQLGWNPRCRTLAALDATLADDLATPRDRLACLGAYVRYWQLEERKRGMMQGGTRLSQVARRICKETARLLRHRHIREQRQTPLGSAVQNLIWLDGEALCVTREFQEIVQNRIPDWLTSGMQGRSTSCQLVPQVEMTRLGLPIIGQAVLTRRRADRPLAKIWTWLRRRPPTSPEFQQAAMIFRLERYGIKTARLLAVGEQHLFPWRTESLLLTEYLSENETLLEWLGAIVAQPMAMVGRTPLSTVFQPDKSVRPNRAVRIRRQLIREAGKLLRRMHEASCYFQQPAEAFLSKNLLVRHESEECPVIVLGSVAGIRKCRRPNWAARRLASADVAALRRVFRRVLSRADFMRFVLAYMNSEGLTKDARAVLTRK